MDKKEFIIKLPNKKGADSMKEKGIFVFDSCSLLSIYSFTNKERKEFLSILKELANKNQLWLPYQFLEEFETHRLEKIQEQYEDYAKFESIINSQFIAIDSDQNISKIASHEFLKKFKEKYLNDTKKFHQKIIDGLQNTKKKHPDWRIVDPVKKALMVCFGEKIGDAYDDERYDEIILEGRKRYSKFIPPGYKDAEKSRNDVSEKKQFGDLVAWFQIRDYAKTQQKPIAIITDDIKEDWWNKQNGKLFGPRIELMYELYEYAGVHLEMFNTEGFLDYARKELKIHIEDTLLEKVKKIKNEKDTDNIPVALAESELGTGDKMDLGTPNKHE